ncbi:MAG: nucleotide exchange factor GrpE [Acetobacteraceae bacterium]|nr:nucleotide exchange factor GrpE [Acetobacteraceae bacterium]
MDDHEKERLLDQFRRYLDGIDTVPHEPIAADETNSGADLVGVFVELAALRNEVRGESRQVKDALVQFRSVFGAMESNQTRLEEELRRHQIEARERAQALLRPLFIDLLELRDRLVAGLRQPAPARGWIGRFRRHRTDVAEGWRDGLAILLRRLDRILSERGVAPIDVIGQPFNPRLSRAVGTRWDPARAPGTVVEEIRAGFLWEEELLRVSEVIVNADSSSGETAS